jgi:predicted lactoylglutathione lyase
MATALINIDVPDIAAAERFYTLAGYNALLSASESTM